MNVLKSDIRMYVLLCMYYVNNVFVHNRCGIQSMNVVPCAVQYSVFPTDLPYSLNPLLMSC